MRVVVKELLGLPSSVPTRPVVVDPLGLLLLDGKSFLHFGDVQKKSELSSAHWHGLGCLADLEDDELDNEGVGVDTEVTVGDIDNEVDNGAHDEVAAVDNEVDTGVLEVDGQFFRGRVPVPFPPLRP